ncbi:MAG: hypothetical protein ABIO50_00570 [Nitrosospira sp.]
MLHFATQLVNPKYLEGQERRHAWVARILPANILKSGEVTRTLGRKYDPASSG